MYRRVWTLAELLNILRAVAMGGGDARTLAMIAVALGLEPELAMIEEGKGDMDKV